MTGGPDRGLEPGPEPGPEPGAGPGPEPGAGPDLLLGRVRAGELTMADFRITAQTLLHQAEVARAHQNPQLAANFERAAELVDLPDEEVLALYELLRPRRATAAELADAAAALESRGAVRNAALVREAAAVYARRGLLRLP